MQAHILGFHCNEGILEVDPDAGSLQPVAWALGIREDFCQRNHVAWNRALFEHLPSMTATARQQLNRCCEWRQNAHGKLVWRITNSPWLLSESDRTRGSSVDSQAAMKNLKTFGRYLFSDENIMYIIFILGRALFWSKHATPQEWYTSHQ